MTSLLQNCDDAADVGEMAVTAAQRRTEENEKSVCDAI
jgi:hypothetical protein